MSEQMDKTVLIEGLPQVFGIEQNAARLLDNESPVARQPYGTDEFAFIRYSLLMTGYTKVLHPQGRSYIEIVTNPEGPEPKKEVWVRQ